MTSNRRPSGLELTLLAVVVVVIAGAAVIGGGDESGNGSAGERATTGSTAGNVRVAPIERRIERLRGLRFRQPLKIVFAPPARAHALLRAASEAEYGRHDQLIDEESLKLLGLLAPAVHLDRYLRAIEREQVLGFYDEHSKRLVVVTGKVPNRSLQEITLAHELVHALEDQHYGVHTPSGFSGDRALAESALFEGTATALMSDYATRYMDVGDALALLDVTKSATKLPPFLEEELLFPYEHGERFVDAFRLRGSWTAIDKLIEFRRPRTTEQVMHPAKYAIGEGPVAVTPPALGRVLGAGWRRLRTTEIGELDLKLLFDHVGGVKDERAAAGWGGGRFELWRKTGKGDCAAPCVSRDASVISLAWDAREDRGEGETALRRVFERGLEGKRVAAGAGIGIWSSRGGAIGMLGIGKRTTVALAPDAALVAKILRPESFSDQRGEP